MLKSHLQHMPFQLCSPLVMATSQLIVTWMERNEQLSALNCHVLTNRHSAKYATQNASRSARISDAPVLLQVNDLAAKPAIGRCTQEAPAGDQTKILLVPVHEARRRCRGSQPRLRMGLLCCSTPPSSIFSMSQIQAQVPMLSLMVTRWLPSQLHAIWPVRHSHRDQVRSMHLSLAAGKALGVHAHCSA